MDPLDLLEPMEIRYVGDVTETTRMKVLRIDTVTQTNITELNCNLKMAATKIIEQDGRLTPIPVTMDVPAIENQQLVMFEITSLS